MLVIVLFLEKSNCTLGSECEESELNSGLSSIWDPFKGSHSASAALEITKSPEKKYGSLKPLVYCVSYNNHVTIMIHALN